MRCYMLQLSCCTGSLHWRICGFRVRYRQLSYVMKGAVQWLMLLQQRDNLVISSSPHVTGGCTVNQIAPSMLSVDRVLWMLVHQVAGHAPLALLRNMKL